MASIFAQTTGEQFTMMHGDCAHGMADMPDGCVDFSIYSIPFLDIFVYSDSVADLGNTKNDAEFYAQYGHIVREKLRVHKPGRLSAVHCTDLPTRKGRDGFIGLKDFSGEICRAHHDAGWIYHCRVTIWRDPVVEMQRTKALGLLYKQLKKDSTMSRVGLADYLMVFRKPGDNPVPVAQDPNEVPVGLWQKWASPVWMDIDQTDVLNVRAAREADDERHLCPLQLGVIDQSVRLWSNPGEVVLSPFAGIGSEGYGAIRAKRKFVGIELKETYYKQAVKNLLLAEQTFAGGDLFSRAMA